MPSGLWIETSLGEIGAKLAFVNESAVVFGAKVIVERGQAMKNRMRERFTQLDLVLRHNYKYQV